MSELDNNKKSKHTGLKVVAVILLLLSVVLSIKAYSSGITLEQPNNDNLKKYTSIDNLKSQIGMNIDVPEYLSEQPNLEIESTMGQFVTIHNDSMVFKAGYFVDVKADPLGLYSDAETDKQYNVSNSDILYYRYRSGYEDYKHCTILNWCSSEYCYGLMIGSSVTEEEALEILGLTQEQLTVYTEDNEEEPEDVEASTEDNSVITQLYTIGNYMKIELPVFSDSFKQEDFEGYSTFSFNDKLTFVIIYDDTYMNGDTFSGQSSLSLDDKATLYYLSENPFETNDTAYKDYDNFIKTINNISTTIIYQ